MAISPIGHVDVTSGTLVFLDFGLVRAFGDDPESIRSALGAALAPSEPHFEHEGVCGVAVRGVAPGRYPVLGETLDDGEYAGMRRTVIVDFAPGVPAARTVDLGSVLVDMARIGVFDAESLAGWNESEPADGKADVVFWGLHEQEVAKRISAPRLADGTFGFLDRAEEEAIAVARDLHELRGAGELRFAFDYRPHTHPYFLLAQMRSNESEAGVIEVGGHAVCGFMTTWGDGMFPVRADLDAAGRPLRCTVIFATDDAMANMREVNGG